MKTNISVDSTENKLIMLFMLDKMEIPLTENNIIDICTSKNNWLDYMDCKDVLWQLQDVGFIYKTIDSEDESRYNITIKGRNCLSEFYQKIRAHIREDIAKFAKENRMNFKRSQEYVSKYIKNTDGSRTAILKICDPLESEHIFEIKIRVHSRKQALSITNKWKDNAPQIYEYILDVLGEN